MRLFSRPVAALAVMTGLFAAISPVGAHTQTAHADKVTSVQSDWPNGWAGGVHTMDLPPR